MSLPAPTQPPKSRLSKAEIIQLLADVTGTDPTLWAFERGLMQYTVELTWEVSEPNFDFVATIQGLRAAAIKNEGPPQSFQVSSRYTSTTAGFSLKQQWANSPSIELSNRQFLHLQIEDQHRQDDRTFKIMVLCDYWGNALRNHADLIRQAAKDFRDTHQPAAAPQTQLGQVLGLEFGANRNPCLIETIKQYCTVATIVSCEIGQNQAILRIGHKSECPSHVPSSSIS